MVQTKSDSQIQHEGMLPHLTGNTRVEPVEVDPQKSSDSAEEGVDDPCHIAARAEDYMATLAGRVRSWEESWLSDRR